MRLLRHLPRFAEPATSGDDTLTGTTGDDALYGLAGNDTLYGLGGNDLLDGGTGNDAMRGGAGDDLYYVDSGSDQVTENSAEGIDTVYAAVSFATAADAEVEILAARDPTSTTRINLTGNLFNNQIRGNEGANILDSGAGNDTLQGFGGDDILYGKAGVDTLEGGAGNDRLIGGTGFDVMHGGTGDDIFDATTTTDIYGDKNRMYGEQGNDIYIVDRSNDVVFEAVGEGRDVVLAYQSFGLGVGSEVEVIRARSDLAFQLGGNEFNNALFGNEIDNVLLGFGGDDLLEGGAGNDSLDGGDGVDIASYETAASAVRIDLSRTDAQDTGGAGIDTLLNIERVTGTAFADKLTGNGSNNVLSGAAGNDILWGGGGNDVLQGGEGADQLNGGTGLDQMLGGAGADLFIVGNADVPSGGGTADRIRDLSQAEGDRIGLSGIDANLIAAGDQAFQFIGTQAFHHSAGELRYAEANGNTYVQADTNGDGAADFIIQLDGSHSPTAGDFIL